MGAADSTRPEDGAGTHPERSGVLRLYADIWRYARGVRGRFVLALLLLLGAQLLRLLIPFCAGRAINTLQLEGLAGTVAAAGWLVLVFACTAASWCLHGPARVLERNVALVVRSGVSATLIGKFLALPLAWHETAHSGATAHRIGQSSRALFEFAQNQFVYLQNGVRLVGPVFALWLIEPAVGAAALGGLAGVSSIIVAYDRRLMRYAHRENETERAYVAALVDALGNILSVHALRQTRGVMELLRRRLLAVYAPLKRYIVLNEAKWASVDLFSQALSCALLVLYVWLTARGLGRHAPAAGARVPLGNVYMVWEYAQQAGSVVAAIAANFQGFARQRADYAAGDVVHRAPPAHFADLAPQAAAPDWRTLELRGLRFRHPRAAAGTYTIEALDLELQRGRRYALVGPSGSGKSTILRLLAGLYLPEALHLLVDGVALDEPREAARFLRVNATLLPQDAEIFEGSVGENLLLCETLSGPPRAERVDAALQAASADFVGRGGVDLAARVAEGGANFSGGQRQRLALARGFLAAEGSPLLLLDEPTASLDVNSERRVHERLFAAFPEACIVSSVHRLNLLPHFDRIVLLEHGRAVDQGGLGELQERCVAFRALFAAQMQGEQR